MAAVCVFAPTIGALKSALVEQFPSVKSSHLTEALAWAIGFRTHAALKAKFVSQLPTDVIAIKDGAFAERLSEFGHILPDHFSFGAVDLLEGNSAASIFIDISQQSLVLMGQDDPELYHLCRALQERGEKLPTFLSHRTIAPLLLKQGLNDKGLVKIQLTEKQRHLDELLTTAAIGRSDSGSTLETAVYILDFNKTPEDRHFTARGVNDLAQHPFDKVVVKGMPNEASWKPLFDLAFHGCEVQFAEVFNLNGVHQLPVREVASVLTRWQSALVQMANIYKLQYDLKRSISMGASIAAFNSLGQQFFTTVGACGRNSADAPQKLEILLDGLRQARLVNEGLVVDGLMKTSVARPDGWINSPPRSGRFYTPQGEIERMVSTPVGLVSNGGEPHPMAPAAKSPNALKGDDYQGIVSFIANHYDSAMSLKAVVDAEWPRSIQVADMWTSTNWFKKFFVQAASLTDEVEAVVVEIELERNSPMTIRRLYNAMVKSGFTEMANTLRATAIAQNPMTPRASSVRPSDWESV